MDKQYQYKISAVICSYNRERFLFKAIDSLLKQDIAAADYEIIVVDNNSTDNTAALLLAFKQKHPQVNFNFFIEKNQGVSYARTRCVVEAKGAIVAFLDDDCVANPNWLSTALTFFANNPACASVGGKIIPNYLAAQPEWYSRYFFGLVGYFDLGKSNKRLTGSKYPCGANMAFRREIFDEIGFFNTAIGRSGGGLSAGEEKDIYFKILAMGKQVFYVPEMVVYHAVEENKFDKAYVKRHSMGIGYSEKIRIQKQGLFSRSLKLVEYILKWGYAIVYGIGFLVKGQWAKFRMLERFRWWVIVGYLSKNYQ